MDSRFGELAERASKLMQKHSIPGMALGMIIDGTDHAMGLGITSTETQLGVDERTLFQIGSTTKTFTAIALARLSEEGTLHLDDSVHSHVPELKLADQDVADTITVRHLLNHTTGFAGDLFANTGNGDNSTALYIEHMRELPQLLPPGTIGVYNNAAFVLAGRVIEKVTGETYESALRSLVLDPIGLHESFSSQLQ